MERLNQTILSTLATTLDNHAGEWEDYLAKVCFSYNTSRQASTGYSAFYLMLERKVRIPLDIVFGTPTSEVADPSEYAQTLRERLEKCLRDNLGTAAERQKEYYNRRVHGEPYHEGDYVWLLNPAVPRGQSKKLYCRWVGPFKVVKCLSDSVYRVENTHSGRKRQIVYLTDLSIAMLPLQSCERTASVTHRI